MYPKLGLTRNVLRRNYALITPDGHVPSSLPGWTRCKAYVLISGAMPGAQISQVLLDLEEGGTGKEETGRQEYFVYVLGGRVVCNEQELAPGGYAYLPAFFAYELTSLEPGTRLLIFGKRYEPLPGLEKDPAVQFRTGREQDVPGLPFLGDPHARLQTLLPDAPAMDMAVNIFTYDPGATLPFVETHIMEHGILFLAGSGVYRLGDDWHPVQAGDALWIASYCPQWFIAAGPEPARYIYYKDVNRLP